MTEQRFPISTSLHRTKEDVYQQYVELMRQYESLRTITRHHYRPILTYASKTENKKYIPALQRQIRDAEDRLQDIKRRLDKDASLQGAFDIAQKELELTRKSVEEQERYHIHLWDLMDGVVLDLSNNKYLQEIGTEKEHPRKPVDVERYLYAMIP